MVVIGLGKNLLFKSILAHCVFSCTGNSKNNLLSYCGLFDTKISGSEKYLPLKLPQIPMGLTMTSIPMKIVIASQLLMNKQGRLLRGHVN